MLKEIRTLPLVVSICGALILSVVGCGGDDPEPGAGACVPEECVNPPADHCDGDVLITYDSQGTCVDDECSYTFAETSCDYGCGVDEDGVATCLDEGGDPGVPGEELCEDVDCSTPPDEVSCDGDVLVSLGPGTCNPETGECEYPEIEENCATRNLICDEEEGACVERCFGVVCDDPPADRCQGNIAITYPETGTCRQATGECRYTESSRNCAAEGMICDDGQCVDLCDGVVCDGPEVSQYCNDAGNAIVLRQEGQCQWDTGECRYLPQAEYDCNALQQVCVDGSCEDLCAGNPCNIPPADYCNEDGWAITYAPVGSCDWRTGDCSFNFNATNCAATDRVCSDGTCINLCTGVTCEDPPPAECEGGTRIWYAETGTCSWDTGLCNYEMFTEDCGDSQQVCEAGLCLDLCADVECGVTESPDPFCQGSIRNSFADDGVCDWTTGQCDFEQFTEDCHDTQEVCRQGACVDLCAETACDTPPASTCEAGTTIISYNPEGECVWLSGECFYTPQQTDCAENEEVCELVMVGDDESVATCVDLCDGVVCEQQVDPAVCDGNELVSEQSLGQCQWESGECVYGEQRIDCEDDQRVCRTIDPEGVDPAGECVNLCDGVVCDDLPSAYCSDEVAVHFEGICRWSDGECEYIPIEEDCEEGIPAPHCEGNVAVSYRDGFCDTETFQCDYFVDQWICDDDMMVCSEGFCYGVIPCTQACTDDLECGNADDLCVSVIDGDFCMPDCTQTDVCPEDYICTLVDETTGNKACLPERDYCIDVECSLDTDCDHPVCSQWPVCQPGYNFDFEDWSQEDPPRGFLKSVQSNFDVFPEVEDVFSGNYSAYLSVPNQVGTARGLAARHLVPAMEEVEYSMHLWFNFERTDEVERSVRTSMQFYTSNGQNIGNRRFHNHVMISTNGWQEMVLTTTSPLETALIEPTIWLANATVLADDMAITRPVDFNTTDGLVDSNSLLIGEGADPSDNLHAAINNKGVVYVATNPASYSAGTDRMVAVWLGGSCQCPYELPWQKIGNIDGPDFDGGEMFLLSQREDEDGNFTCEWSHYGDLGWLSVTEGASCGDGTQGAILEGTIDVPALLALSEYNGSLSASVHADISFGAFSVQTADGGRIVADGAVPATLLYENEWDEERLGELNVGFEGAAHFKRSQVLTGKVHQ